MRRIRRRRKDKEEDGEEDGGEEEEEEEEEVFRTSLSALFLSFLILTTFTTLSKPLFYFNSLNGLSDKMKLFYEEDE